LEDICYNDWRDVENPTFSSPPANAIEIMGREMGRQEPTVGSAGRQQRTYHAVLKLNFLLCCPTWEDVRFTSAGVDAVEGFESMMAEASYPRGEVVSSYDFHGNPLPVNEKCLPPTVEKRSST
jgi:hypothetical protein